VRGGLGDYERGWTTDKEELAMGVYKKRNIITNRKKKMTGAKEGWD
jgi:hypothetical protein